jgi:hypothetical protein
MSRHVTFSALSILLGRALLSYFHFLVLESLT